MARGLSFFWFSTNVANAFLASGTSAAARNPDDIRKVKRINRFIGVRFSIQSRIVNRILPPHGGSMAKKRAKDSP